MSPSLVRRPTLLAREQATDAVASVIRRVYTLSPQPLPPVRQWEYYPLIGDSFRFGYGFWIAIGILSALAAVNAALATGGRLFYRRRVETVDEPEATTPA